MNYFQSTLNVCYFRICVMLWIQLKFESFPFKAVFGVKHRFEAFYNFLYTTHYLKREEIFFTTESPN